jgi:hypothetical protein
VSEVAADVRRRDHRSGAPGGRGPHQLEALVERRRAVIEARQGVEVDLNPVHACEHRARGRHPVNLLLPACGRFVNKGPLPYSAAALAVPPWWLC